MAAPCACLQSVRGPVRRGGVVRPLNSGVRYHVATSANWNGHTVVVTSTLISRYLWQTASIDVFVDENCVLRTGGQAKITGSHRETFHFAGSTHEAALSWGRAGLRSFPVQLTIDGQKIVDSRVRTANWAIGFWPWVAALLALICLGAKNWTA